MTESSRFWNGIVTGDATEAPYNADTEFANYTKRAIGSTRANAGVVHGTNSESAQLPPLQVTENSPAGMSILLNIGAALVNGSQYDNDAALTVAIAANASGNPRIDTIVLRKSWAAQEVRAAILQGTPAASPVPAALTTTAGVTWEIAIADVAVANGAVSITNANITPRDIPSIALDGVYLDSMNNNSGAVRQTGDVVVLDSTADRATTTATAASNPAALGAVVGRAAAGALNEVVINRGIGYVNTSGGASRGSYVNPDAAGLATASSNRLYNTAGYFLETVASGKALALLDMGMNIRPNFGKLLENVRSSTANLIVDNIPQHYPTLVIEMAAQSAIAATNETMNIRLGSAGGGGALDTTATNYYSYAGFIALAAAAVSSLQNLGATAAWQITIPGSTAVEGAFYLVMTIRNANIASASRVKVMTGTAFLKITNANGGLFVINFGGRWNGAAGAKALEQINIVTASAAVLTGTEVNVYGKDGVLL